MRTAASLLAVTLLAPPGAAGPPDFDAAVAPVAKHDWDLAAADLIATEAGAFVGDHRGDVGRRDLSSRSPGGGRLGQGRDDGRRGGGVHVALRRPARIVTRPASI